VTADQTAAQGGTPLQGPFGVAVTLREVTAGELASAWSGGAAPGWAAKIDGARFCAEAGRDGDHRFEHAGRSLHHLNADGTVLRCAFLGGAPPGPARWRVTFDSVLFSVALLAGREALHAGAVAVPAAGGAVAIAAAAGGGKSTLLAELVRRGLPLVTDDVAVLEGKLVHPGPPLMTVPAAAAGPALGEPLADLDGGERWLAVPVVERPLPLAALVLLDRRTAPGAPGPPRMEPVTDPFAPLLSALLRYPATPERERARFELASRLADRPIWRLRADAAVPPERLADALLATLPVAPMTTGTEARASNNLDTVASDASIWHLLRSPAAGPEPQHRPTRQGSRTT
jgi:hypothetical protein